jgi:hypothetical protein
MTWNAGSWMAGMEENSSNLVGNKKGLRYAKKGQSLKSQQGQYTGSCSRQPPPINRSLHEYIRRLVVQRDLTGITIRTITQTGEFEIFIVATSV